MGCCCAGWYAVACLVGDFPLLDRADERVWARAVVDLGAVDLTAAVLAAADLGVDDLAVLGLSAVDLAAVDLDAADLDPVDLSGEVDLDANGDFEVGDLEAIDRSDAVRVPVDFAAPFVRFEDE